MEHGSDPLAALRRRAAGRFRRFVVLLGVLTGLAVGAGFAVGAASSDRSGRPLLVGLLIVAAVLGALVAVTVAVGLAVRRRGVELVSPLWGVDRATRSRVARAIRRQEELTGTDRALALAETARSRRLGPLAVVLLSVAAALILVGLGLQFADDAHPARLALGAAHVALLVALAVHQLVFYRRSAAYLARYGPAGTEPAGPEPAGAEERAGP